MMERIQKNDIKDVISDPAFLYSMWSGPVTVDEGKVFRIRDYEKVATFRNKDGKAISCHPEPEKVYNAMIWLPERDDLKAAALLAQYHEKSVEELKKKIESHLTKIALIKGGF